RWLLLVSIVASAWLFGGTRDWTIEVIRWLLLAMTALFVIGLAFRRRWPRVPWLVVLPSLFLLLQGWFMVWNAQSRFLQGPDIFLSVNQPLAGWPGFWDASLVIPSLLTMTGLLGVSWIACDLAPNKVWRDRLWITIALAGVSIMVLGLAQRLTDAPGIFWYPYRFTGKTFFAVFRYHANAGAYINLVLPFIAGLAVRAFYREGAEKGRVFWTLAAFVTAACGFINTSRAANVVCALILLGMVVWILSARLQSLRSRRWLASGATALTLMGAAAVLAVSFGMERTVGRWEKGWDDLFDNSRYQVYDVLVSSAIPATGWWGHGPGTFVRVFNIHRDLTGNPVKGWWVNAHSDALQTPVDYGWAGAIAWLLLLGGGLVVAGQAARHGGRRPGDRAILGMSCAFSLGGVMLHTFVDYPLQIASLQLYTMVIA
ncbi:MAG: O-antigen ligase family protein, partial [Chthoniobacterales bacterium]